MNSIVGKPILFLPFIIGDLPQRRREVKPYPLHNILIGVIQILGCQLVILNQLHQALVLSRQVGVLLRQPRLLCKQSLQLQSHLQKMMQMLSKNSTKTYLKAPTIHHIIYNTKCCN